jgi:hypothetical protein
VDLVPARIAYERVTMVIDGPEVGHISPRVRELARSDLAAHLPTSLGNMPRRSSFRSIFRVSRSSRFW